MASKPFLLRRRFMDPNYAQLGQLWGPEDPYMDLAASAADAVVHFRSQKDHKTEEHLSRESRKLTVMIQRISGK